MVAQNWKAAMRQSRLFTCERSMVHVRTYKRWRCYWGGGWTHSTFSSYCVPFSGFSKSCVDMWETLRKTGSISHITYIIILMQEETVRVLACHGFPTRTMSWSCWLLDPETKVCRLAPWFYTIRCFLSLWWSLHWLVNLSNVEDNFFLREILIDGCA